MTYSDLILLLTGYRASKPARGGVVEAGRAFCPSHQSGAGRGRTLSTAQSSAGAILLHCHAGCTPHDICGALGIDESDLFPDVCRHVDGSGRGVGTTWYPALSIADQIEEEVVSLPLILCADELHQRIQSLGQLIKQFKTACRAAARKGGAA